MRLLRRQPKPPALSNSPRQRLAAEDSPASPKFNYRARRSDAELNIGRQTQREAIKAAPSHLKRFMLQRFGLVLLLGALVVCTVNILSLSSEPRILPLTAGDTVPLLHDKAVYQEAASQLLASSIWNRNKITVNTSSMNQQLQARFPELSDVSTTLPLLSKRPIIYIETAKPALILITRDGSFVVGQTGKALLLTANLPAHTSLSLPLVTDQSGLRVKLGSQALSSDDTSFIKTVIAQLSAKRIAVSSMLLPSATSELDVRIADHPYAIKFNLESGEARQQVGTFLATQAKLDSQHVVPAQYIDVRVEGRAYYQ